MPEELDGGFRVTNTISGGDFDAVVQGGRVEVHFNSPRPEEQPLGRRSVRYRAAGALVLLGGTVVCWGLLNPRERLLLPGAHRGVELVGALLLLAGVVWGTAVHLGVPERLRERRAPSRRLAPAELDQVLDRLAEALAAEYTRDETQSRVQDPVPIPVRWSAADPLVSDHEANVRRTPATVVRDAAGEQPLDLQGHFDDIGRFFTSLPGQRLVMLGAPGAGKSVLALHLALTLLKERARGGAVPVLLPLASWKPTEEDPWHWAARRLTTLHPSVLRTRQLAHDLITSGRILPILDGLDELPEPTRPKALVRLRRSLNDPARIVLTCRIEEYEEAVAEAEMVLPAAAVVQLQSLGVDDLAAYLPRTALRTSRAEAAETKWAPVLAELKAVDRSPQAEVLRSVLSTPLMVSLARFVYSETRADPKELFDFPDRAAVERHLFDAFLSATYEDTSGRPWTGEQARRWAGYLAAHLRRSGEQDIEWWRLGGVVHWSVRWLGTGLAVGVASLAVGLTTYDHPWWREWLLLPPWVVVLCLGSLAALVDWSISPPMDPPQRLRWPNRDEFRVWRANLPWLLRGLLLCLMVLPWLLITRGELRRALAGIMVAIGVLLTSYLVARLLDLVSGPADPADAPEPAALLRADRRTALVLGVFAPFRRWHRRLLTEIVLGAAFLMAILWQVLAEPQTMATRTWPKTAALLLFAWLLCSWSASAGGRFTLARLWLSLRGRLPLRLMTFLRDAHSRGVLRQSGGLYRFRHIELRNRLAELNGVTADTVDGPVSTRRTRPYRRSSHNRALTGSFILSTALWVSFLSVPDFLPFPLSSNACAVLPLAQVRQVIVEPVRHQSRLFCDYDEKSPFRPDRSASVALWAWGRPWGDNAWTDRAQSQMRWYRKPGNRPLPGLGDEAVLVSGRSGPDVLPQAAIAVRAGNVMLVVGYTEEYARPDRVVEVARFLAREALRAVGVPAERIGPAGPGLATVPPTQVPATTRFSAYRRPERSVYGAVWRGDEYSDIVALGRQDLIVRLSPGASCTEFGLPRHKDEYSYRCQSPDVLSGDGSGPGLVLDLTDRACLDRCSEAETRDFQQRLPDWEQSRWKAASTGDALVAVHLTKDARYELSLFVTHTPPDGPAHLLRIRAAVDADQAVLAQKIINSAYTQTR